MDQQEPQANTDNKENNLEPERQSEAQIETDEERRKRIIALIEDNSARGKFMKEKRAYYEQTKKEIGAQWIIRTKWPEEKIIEHLKGHLVENPLVKESQRGISLKPLLKSQKTSHSNRIFVPRFDSDEAGLQNYCFSWTGKPLHNWKIHDYIHLWYDYVKPATKNNTKFAFGVDKGIEIYPSRFFWEKEKEKKKKKEKSNKKEKNPLESSSEEEKDPKSKTRKEIRKRNKDGIDDRSSVERDINDVEERMEEELEDFENENAEGSESESRLVSGPNGSDINTEDNNSECEGDRSMSISERRPKKKNKSQNNNKQNSQKKVKLDDNFSKSMLTAVLYQTRVLEKGLKEVKKATENIDSQVTKQVKEIARSIVEETKAQIQRQVRPKTQNEENKENTEAFWSEKFVAFYGLVETKLEPLDSFKKEIHDLVSFKRDMTDMVEGLNNTLKKFGETLEEQRIQLKSLSDLFEKNRNPLRIVNEPGSPAYSSKSKTSNKGSEVIKPTLERWIAKNFNDSDFDQFWKEIKDTKSRSLTRMEQESPEMKDAWNKLIAASITPEWVAEHAIFWQLSELDYNFLPCLFHRLNISKLTKSKKVSIIKKVLEICQGKGKAGAINELLKRKEQFPEFDYQLLLKFDDQGLNELYPDLTNIFVSARDNLLKYSPEEKAKIQIQVRSKNASLMY